MNNLNSLVFASAILLLATGCAERQVIYQQQVPYQQAQPVPSAPPSCQQVAWDGAKWVCMAYTGTVAPSVVTQTFIIDNVMYGVVGGFIAGYWVGNAWFHGVPPRFVPPRGYGIAPRGYAVIPRSYVVPRGFGGRGRR